MAAQQLTPAEREQIHNNIAKVWTIDEYIAWLNRDLQPGDFGLTADLDHWAGYGITTAPQLADYIDGCFQRNIEKSERCA